MAYISNQYPDKNPAVVVGIDLCSLIDPWNTEDAIYGLNDILTVELSRLANRWIRALFWWRDVKSVMIRIRIFEPGVEREIELILQLMGQSLSAFKLVLEYLA